MISDVLGAASLVVRLRRAEGEERAQLKWFTFAAALIALLLPASIPGLIRDETLSDLLFGGASSRS